MPNFEDMLKIEDEIVPIYRKLADEKENLFIWGNGALAKRIHRYCEYFGIVVQGCFVNVVSTKSSFEGLPVYSLEELENKYERFSVIVGHANYFKGTEYLKKLKNVKNIYCISSICYDMWNEIPIQFLKDNSDSINDVYMRLEDDLSKKCFETYFESRINDNARYMFPYFDENTTYYRNDIFQLSPNETLLDVGACTGSAIQMFIDTVNGEYATIIALEPDVQNFELLEKSIVSNKYKNIILKKVCANNKNGYVYFKCDGESGGISESSEDCQRYPAQTLDSLCIEQKLENEISIIKINFAFSVKEILEGAKEILLRSKPKLIIRVGFDEEVLISTCSLISQINSDYKFYLRYTLGIPQGLTLFAV